MMPLAAILSTSDWALPSALVAAALSLPSTALRSALSPVRSLDRICRFASRRLTFCRCAFSADLFRFATSENLGCRTRREELPLRGPAENGQTQNSNRSLPFSGDLVGSVLRRDVR